MKAALGQYARISRTLVVAVSILATVAVPAAGAAGEADATGELLRALDFTRCGMKPDPGPCKARFERYYFDEKSRACRPFFWGGCEGAVPFETAEACEQACLPARTLRITSLQSREGDVYAQVSLEFPKAWRQPAFTLLVDGREVPARAASGGFSADRQMESFIFFPGRPGRKHVAVTTEVAGQRVEASGWLEWTPAPLVALVGHTGDRELILDTPALTLVTLNVDAPTVRFNGAEVRPESFGRDARLLRFQPSWVPGENALTVHGTAFDGAPVSRSFSFVYA
ncbi:MAG: BPTI/Kunitz domain-containing protein, partial [Candidatus Methylomirabilales bacterium]